MKDEHRPYDVVLYGATGFTGRQTAAYFSPDICHSASIAAVLIMSSGDWLCGM